jgi:2-polyprenyl-6-methoxyphenol hydroxylase-like FAD-dependent oxidoreductase
MKHLPFIIVGGGIGGLATALALSKNGLASDVLEAAPDFREIGAGIQLGPNVFKMFDMLGLNQPIHDIAVFPDNLVMRDALSGELVTIIPVKGPFRKRYKYPYGVIHRGDLHGVLLDACRKTPLVSLTPSQKVDAYVDRGDRVIVKTDQGNEYEGAAVIGADGLWSRVRAQLVGDGKPRVSGHIAYRGVIPTREVPAHLQSNDVILWAGPKTHLVHYPLRRGELYNLVVVFHSRRYEEGWNSYGDPAELKEHFTGQQPQVLEFLAMVEEWRMWVLCDREPISRWSEGRATMIGDAAHPMLQYLAQGACMAIEDAVILAKHAAATPDDLPGAFVRYQRERYLRTTRLQVTARIYGEIYHAADAVRDLRKAMLAGRSVDQVINGMAWLYDGIEV